MTGSPSGQALRQRVIRTAAGRVHLWTGGKGPAVILMHGSPGNAWLVAPIAERLARRFCVYAIDTPGFGGSDALSATVTSVAQLADGYRDILDALGLENTLVYGTHSGAAIGLELARRHPERVSGFVLEGVPAFTPEEMRPLLAPEYLVALEPEVLGGQYARTWTRFHDQFVWFPWYRREPSHLNEADAGSAADIHLWVEMYFQACRHDYRPAYRAVISYGEAALAAARAVKLPGVYMAERSDMLYPHLDRLPPLHAGQRIERVMSPSAVPEAIEAALASLPASSPGVSLGHFVASSQEYFHDLLDGQMLVRSRADSGGTPLLLLHDAPGGGRQLLDLYDAVSTRRAVLLPDLPGCAESDPLEGEAAAREPSLLADYADAIAGMLTARAGGAVQTEGGVSAAGAVHVYAQGFGAAVALELNSRHPQLVATLTLSGVLRAPRTARDAMIGRLAPPIALADDGSHWYRTWLMLRNSLVRWPWYAREPAALRRQAITLDPQHLHAWTCDVMRQCNSYHRLIDAVLRWSPADALARGAAKLTIALDSRHALYAADVEWAASGVKSIELPETAAGRALALESLFG